ncbi:MAG: cell wall hydrolase [Pseudomonadota bacterium]
MPALAAAIGQRDRMRATLCLASAIYYEAATESDDGQRAVAQVVLNRVRHGSEWPNTVCGVVYEGSNEAGCQFSFACDGAMARTPSLTAWIRARRVAEAALSGQVYAPVGSATFYHTTAVAPGWRTRMVPMSVVGAHIFYRLPGDAPDAASLPAVYEGGEPMPGPLPSFAMVAAIAPLPVEPTSVPASPQTAKPAAQAIADTPPESDIRPEWRDSGTWIAGR